MRENCISVSPTWRKGRRVRARPVDFMLEELKFEFHDDSEPAYMAQVRALVAQGKLLDAIRVYRKQTGESLAGAKAFVEGLPNPPR